MTIQPDEIAAARRRQGDVESARRPSGPVLDDPKARFTFIECLSNIRNVNGRPKQLTKGDPDYIDYYGRPWAKNWEKYLEAGWDKPQDDIPAAITDIFK